jgi:hypothetical protein
MNVARLRVMQAVAVMKTVAIAALATAVLAAGSGIARAAPIFDQTAVLDQTAVVAATGTAPAYDFSFTATTAQALVVTLTDAGLPAAFQSLQIAVTLGDTLVGTASVDGSTGKTSATVAVPAATGRYQIHVVGTPTNSSYGAYGSFSVCTAPAAAPTACITADSTSSTINAPSTAVNTGTSTLNTGFTSTVAGNYTVSITDDQFPVALTRIKGGVTQGGLPVNVNGFTLGSNTVTLSAATNYQLLLVAQANASLNAGLYAVQITDPNGNAVFTRTLPVGLLPSSTVVANPSAPFLGLTLTDLVYPTPLTSVGAAVTAGASLLTVLNAAGASGSFAAPSGNLEVWQFAVAGTSPGIYSLVLASPSSTLYSKTQVVNPADAAAQTSFAFEAAVAAGTYAVTVTDFQFPTALSTLSSTVAQDGAVVTADSAGNYTVSAGTLIVIVNATAAAATGTSSSTSGLGIFGVTIATTAATPSTVLDQTQAVGGAFNVTTVDVGTSGSYNVTLADLGFPQTFEDLAVVVSQGSQVLGKIYGAGSFPFAAKPGSYELTFVATPGTSNYGLYGIEITPAAPTVTLTSNTTSVTTGLSVQLTWTTTNATSCTASGASDWSGNEPTSSLGVGVAISASETLTLTCTGAGGSGSSSVSITATAAPTRSGGGGIGVPGVLALGVLWGLRERRSRRMRTPTAANATHSEHRGTGCATGQ